MLSRSRYAAPALDAETLLELKRIADGVPSRTKPACVIHKTLLKRGLAYRKVGSSKRWELTAMGEGLLQAAAHRSEE